MAQTHPTSVRLTSSNKMFVLNLKKKSPKASGSHIINTALEAYQKYHLRKQLMEESEENPERDVAMSEEDFESYKAIINEAEAI